MGSCLVSTQQVLTDSLPSGGMRGIVELEVLKAIEYHIGVGIPVRAFFDLIVGTR
jgi:patatin-like phospholipase/acyl hydrolase